MRSTRRAIPFVRCAGSVALLVFGAACSGAAVAPRHAEHPAETQTDSEASNHDLDGTVHRPVVAPPPLYGHRVVRYEGTRDRLTPRALPQHAPETAGLDDVAAAAAERAFADVSEGRLTQVGP